MPNPITSTGESHEFHASLARQRPTCVSPQGDANDFSWQIEQSLDDAQNWVAMMNGEGIDTFIGSTPMTFWPVQDARYRVKVTDIGTATSVIVKVGY